jgi:hypothetical protein
MRREHEVVVVSGVEMKVYSSEEFEEFLYLDRKDFTGWPILTIVRIMTIEVEIRT